MYFDKFSKQYYVVSLRYVFFFSGKRNEIDSIELLNLVF